MSSAVETTTAIQDKLLESMQVGQKAMVDVVRSWAEIMETVAAKLPELASTDSPAKPGQFLETALGFTEKVMNSQREFLGQVFEAAVPATRSPASAARSATTQAAAAQAAKPAAGKA